MEKSTIRFVFFGSFHVSADILEGIVNGGLIPSLIVSNPDRPAGRKKVLTAPAVKRRIEEKGWQIPISQPERPTEILDQLLAIDADTYVVMGYPHILPKSLINIPLLGTIGVHPSLLPKYRGASPMQSALLAGETETGITLYLIDPRMDHGPIIAEGKVNIAPDETNTSLEKKCADAAAKLLIETLPKFVEGKIIPTPQNDLEASYTRKFTSEDGFVPHEDLVSASIGDAPQKAIEIERKIRALNPEPGVWTLRDNKRVKLLEAKTKDNRLVLKKIQEAGKNPTERFGI